MSEAVPPSLGDFFGKKAKKKIKGTNLNNATVTGKPEEKKVAAKKSAEEDGWQEDEVVAATMKVEAAGKLTREEEKPETEDTSAPAWGNVRTKDNQLNDRRFPTLAKSVQSSNISLEDNSGKVNISTSKNMFANLEDDDGSDDDKPRRPNKIAPAMVTKKKGEMTKDAVSREVGKFGGKDDKDKADDTEEKERKEVKPKKAKAKLVYDNDTKEAKKEELEEDAKIEADPVASKAKYKGRKKLDRQDLPAKELLEEKENRPVPGGKSKKKFANLDDEDDGKKKLQYIDED
eukprot:TRINITY_DN98346_c0_g1_i1.p1 TRINITY_DN98346_c0_g1~~TRINITY_DN98346_c0_g1_i1.p1  ORF type:complete len:289 (+),score=125.35 TRINITY_DN98346_c0_g1_i1:96-962(+)